MRLSYVAIMFLLLCVTSSAFAQDSLPRDNGLATYHTAPRYRESESHPLRILSYVLHPVGWVAREVIFRPLSYFASSSETRKSIMGYREPYDYREPECFSADDAVPDCRAVRPFNYGAQAAVITEPTDSMDDMAMDVPEVRQVYLPDVNFEFDKYNLTDLGKGRVYQLSEMLKTEPGLRIVLEGHTDYIGSPEYNEKLGVNRAEAVRAELVRLGVSADRLSTVTFGKSQPLLPQEADWARAVNRRVQAHVDTTG